MKSNALPSSLVRALRGYVLTIETLMIAGMVGVVILAALQVFFRYAIGASLSWSEEALRYLMIWIASLGIGLAYSRGEMIGMELLTNSLPRSVTKVIAIVGRLLILAMMLAIVWYGWNFAWKTRAGFATAIPISMFWVHVSVAFGCALVALHVVGAIIAILLGLDTENTQQQETVQ